MLNEHAFLIVTKLSTEPSALFPIGRVTATRRALDLLDRAGVNASVLLNRHQRGDWGSVCVADAAANDEAVEYGGRLLSAYKLGLIAELIWILTEYDRSATTLLLPQEY